MAAVLDKVLDETHHMVYDLGLSLLYLVLVWYNGMRRNLPLEVRP